MIVLYSSYLLILVNIGKESMMMSSSPTITVFALTNNEKPEPRFREDWTWYSYVVALRMNPNQAFRWITNTICNAQKQLKLQAPLQRPCPALNAEISFTTLQSMHSWQSAKAYIQVRKHACLMWSLYLQACYGPPHITRRYLHSQIACDLASCDCWSGACIYLGQADEAIHLQKCIIIIITKWLSSKSKKPNASQSQPSIKSFDSKLHSSCHHLMSRSCEIWNRCNLWNLHIRRTSQRTSEHARLT